MRSFGFIPAANINASRRGFCSAIARQKLLPLDPCIRARIAMSIVEMSLVAATVYFYTLSICVEGMCHVTDT